MVHIFLPSFRTIGETFFLLSKAQRLLNRTCPPGVGVPKSIKSAIVRANTQSWKFSSESVRVKGVKLTPRFLAIQN